MSPPEIWGPAVWNLFHTLACNVNENYYNIIKNSLFNNIIRICKFLPCPECANDANNFLIKIKNNDYDSKEKLINLLYLFHNYVNVKKRKPLFNYSNIMIYKKYNINNVINNFILNYHTKGNMNLLTESFQRDMIVKEFLKWYKYYSRLFIPIKLEIPREIENKLAINNIDKGEINKKDFVPPNIVDNIPTNEGLDMPPNIVDNIPSNEGLDMPPNIVDNIPSNEGLDMPPNIVDNIPSNEDIIEIKINTENIIENIIETPKKSKPKNRKNKKK
jgi:hypothetical protein